MKTLKEIFDDGGAASAQYNTALKVQVCGLGEINNYRNSRGEQRQSLIMGPADETMAAKEILYDISKANKYIDASECHYKYLCYYKIAIKYHCILYM